MKKKLLILLLFIGEFVIAQKPNKFENPNLEGLKIAYLTKVLSLSSEEAQKFWPVYFSYNDQIRTARKENKDNIILFDEKALMIRKKYILEFKNILGSDERANKVFTSEREFGNFIKREIENRQKMRNQMLQNRPIN